MTTEEKARTYDEVIEKAAALYKASEPMSGCNVILETLFPELKESEGEKVRKILFEFFKNYKEQDTCGSETFNGIPTDNILAWLEKQSELIDNANKEYWRGYREGKQEILDKYAEAEKQSEKKPTKWTEEDAMLAEFEKQGEKSVKWNENTDGNKPQKHHSVLMKTTHGITEGEWNGNEFWIQYRWSSSIKDSDVLFWIELSDIEKQGEQKPTDEEMKTILRSEYEKGRADAIAEMQMEWSEEDENRFNRICDALKRYEMSLGASTNDIEWLKSLKGRIQPKQEWSEEDEKILRTILSDGIRGAELDMLQVNWLKSLRPQNKWKPSGGQIEALDFATNCIVPAEFCDKRKVLKELLEQLKKLKEE